jgi:hypothetical protein
MAVADGIDLSIARREWSTSAPGASPARMKRSLSAGMNDAFGSDLPAATKALAAAFAGRALLLLEARRDMPITLRRVLTAVLWEVPLIAAFALIGWHAAELLGFESESARIVLTALLANLGARGLDRLVARILPPPSDRERG